MGNPEVLNDAEFIDEFAPMALEVVRAFYFIKLMIYVLSIDRLWI